ncbi:MAG: retroviral-like aspartic protease family protein [Telluria sp.]
MTFSWRVFCSGAVCAGLPLIAAAADCHYVQLAELPVVSLAHSHQPAIEGSVDGKPVVMLVDTGAYHTMLTQAEAERHGYTLQPTGRVSHGIGGSAMEYAVRVKELGIGPTMARNFAINVLPVNGGLKEYGGIVGADSLLRQDMELALADHKLRFFSNHGCDKGLSYWDPDALEVPLDLPSDHESPAVTVELNGKRLRAIIDTGAARSAVFKDAAEKLGVKLETPAGKSRGVGDEAVQRWKGVFQFKLGDEVVNNASIGVLDANSEGNHRDFDMLLGQDWLEAHRVLLAVSQQKMYFSYLGKPLFDAR